MTAKEVDTLNLTKRELRIVHQSLRASPPKNVFHHHLGRHIRFGYYGDPHMGEKHFHEELWKAMVEMFRKEGIKHVYGVGDNLEGMSGRPVTSMSWHISVLRLNSIMRRQCLPSLPTCGFTSLTEINQSGFRLWRQRINKISLYAGITQEAKSERISTNGQSAGNLRKQRVLNDYTRDTCT